MKLGEKIRQSNAEVVEWTIEKINDPLSRFVTEDSLREQLLAMLDVPCETTADEDFLKMGFRLKKSGSGIYEYEEIMSDGDQTRARIINMIPGGNQYITNGCYVFHDDSIDKIREITKKKRKEIYGGKYE